jgi:hypothetical protein
VPATRSQPSWQTHERINLKILGYKYVIDYSNSVNDINTFGLFSSLDQKISIGNNLLEDQRASTVLHEVMEALNFHLNLDMEHHALTSLEAGLYTVLKENGVDLSKFGVK